MDVDVVTTRDETGVGAIVDPPVVKDENSMVVLNNYWMRLSMIS